MAESKQMEVGVRTSGPELAPRQEDIGIQKMGIYFPQAYVKQEDMEKYDNVSTGKYTIGLGQKGHAFVTDREDIYSICLSAVANFMEKNQLDYNSIGRLEVASETILDHSKSIKSVLMQLFEESGNTDVEGIDCMNACYAGTNALFNSVAWVDSREWDGRLALVVSADIAEYAKGPARPTGGCGAVVMLIGPNATLVMESGLRASHMEHVYDFWKPHLDSPYPVVDGKYSNKCYLRSLDTCLARFSAKHIKLYGRPYCSSEADFVLFHAPYNKLVIKSFARLHYNMFKAHPEKAEYKGYQEFLKLSEKESYASREVEKAFVNHSKEDYKNRVAPSTKTPQELGNLYTASLYAGLISLINSQGSKLAGKSLLLFSYGSGLCSSLFPIRVASGSKAEAELTAMQHTMDIDNRLKSRVAKTGEEFTAAMDLREGLHKKRAFTPESPADSASLFPGTYYLTEKDEDGRRKYARLQAADEV